VKRLNWVGVYVLCYGFNVFSAVFLVLFSGNGSLTCKDCLDV
jgi:hypothetical protein